MFQKQSFDITLETPILFLFLLILITAPHSNAHTEVFQKVHGKWNKNYKLILIPSKRFKYIPKIILQNSYERCIIWGKPSMYYGFQLLLHQNKYSFFFPFPPKLSGVRSYFLKPGIWNTPFLRVRGWSRFHFFCAHLGLPRSGFLL